MRIELSVPHRSAKSFTFCPVARHGKEEQEERQQTDHQHDEQVAVFIHRAPAEAAGEQIAQKQAERLDEPAR